MTRAQRRFHLAAWIVLVPVLLGAVWLAAQARRDAAPPLTIAEPAP